MDDGREEAQEIHSQTQEARQIRRSQEPQEETLNPSTQTPQRRIWYIENFKRRHSPFRSLQDAKEDAEEETLS